MKKNILLLTLGFIAIGSVQALTREEALSLFPKDTFVNKKILNHRIFLTLFGAQTNTEVDIHLGEETIESMAEPKQPNDGTAGDLLLTFANRLLETKANGEEVESSLHVTFSSKKPHAISRTECTGHSNSDACLKATVETIKAIHAKLNENRK